MFATSQSERHVQSAHSFATLFSWEGDKERSHVHGHVHDQNQRTGRGHGTGTATRRIVHWWTTGTRWDDMSGCWSSGTMRRAQYQRAQQRAPSSSMCPWSCDATQYGPSFSGTSKACLSHLALLAYARHCCCGVLTATVHHPVWTSCPARLRLPRSLSRPSRTASVTRRFFDFELHRRLVQGGVSGLEDVNVNSVGGLMTSLTQPPVSVTIDTNSVLLQL